MRRHRAVPFVFALLSILPATVAGQDVVEGKAVSKVGTALAALYEAHQAHERLGDGTTFTPTDPTLRLIEDRVVIDAVASGETDALRQDLDALGMEKAASFGRMVSGQLPIRAIKDADALESLQFARPAGAVRHDTID
jgi:hypothetical protein